MRAIGLIVVVTAAPAFAQPSAVLDMRIRFQHGDPTWHDVVPLSPGATYECALFVSFSEGYGLGGLSTAIVGTSSDSMPGTVDFASAGQGRQTPFTVGPSPTEVFMTSNGFRIDREGDLADSPTQGILLSQVPPNFAGNDFSTANPALVYRFLFTASGTSFPFETVIDAPVSQLHNGRVSVFVGSDSPQSLNITNVVSDPARIVLPSPASLLVLGVLAWLPRRRVC